MTGILIRGARVIDPENSVDEVKDILIRDGRISQGSSEGAEVINAEGMVACPGFIDMHAHLREPGRE